MHIWQQFLKIDKFRKNGKLPPIKDDERLSILLKNLVKNKDIPETLGNCLRTVGSQPAKLYGLPKVHKKDISMRPVLSMVNTAQYTIAKYLDHLLKPLLFSKYECKDSFEFVNFISNLEVNTNTEHMVSFDVVSLFTNVPLNETIDLCCEIWKMNTEGQKFLSVFAFKELLLFATSNVNFLFNEEWYKQVDGVAMGSPLAPTLASIFLSSIEDKINLFMGIKPNVYKRYVDDIFLVFSHEKYILPFLNYLNSLHGNIKFTVENEKSGFLPFLDIMIERKLLNYETGIYRKPTDTGLYTPC